MFKPLHNRIVVIPEERETVTESGIYLAEKIVEKPVIGKVEVGNKEVKKGDKVLFSKFGYDEITIEGVLYYLVSDYNVLAIIND